MLNRYTVVMSLYKSDKPEQFKVAMDSVLNQTIPPSEIILTIDGAIPDSLEEVVSKYIGKVQINRLDKNIGLGASRHLAISMASNTLIAMMDADDVSVKDRFENQLSVFNQSDADVVGGYIAEFEHTVDKLERIRKVPLEHDNIVHRGKSYSPINHVTIMIKKDVYLKSGGYSGLRKIEDYDLYHRLVMTGAKFRNIPEVLVYVHSSPDQYRRRHGIQYLREEFILHTRMFKSKYINAYEYFRNIMVRLPVRILPVFLLKWLSKSVLREQKK